MSRFRGRCRIESARWPEHDYGAPGYYFVTICTEGAFFGAVTGEGRLQPTPAGRIAAGCWRAIPEHFPHVIPDAFVVMPDHVHGIVAIAAGGDPAMDGDPTVETRHVASLARRFGPLRRASLPVIVGQYKAAVTRQARRGGIVGFAWQARYHDRVVRSERELAHVRRYIEQNPLRWALRQRGA